MNSLFTANDLRPRLHGRRRIDRARKRVLIETGAPRLAESAGTRKRRLDAQAWEAFVTRILASALARIDLIADRAPGDHLPCPWAQIYPDGQCVAPCRCEGSGHVTVRFLRDHYKGLIAELRRWA